MLMGWIIFPFVAAILYAICDFTENFMVDTWCRKLRPQCLKIPYLILDIVGIGVILIWQQGEIFSGLSGSVILMLMIGGAINSLGGIPYYSALKKNDTTEVTLLSQMSPVLALIFGVLFLGQVPSAEQGMAFFLILAAMTLVVLGAGRKMIKVELTTGALMLVACLFWVLSDVLFVSQMDNVGFWSGFFWLIVGNILGNIVLVSIMKSWRQDIQRFWQRNRGKKLTALLVSDAMWWIAEVAWRMGMLAAPIAIMSVTGNMMQLILTFILGVILTLIWPKFGREKLNKKIVIHHALATSMLAVAIVLLG